MIHEFLPPNFLDSILQSSYWPKSASGRYPATFDRAEWNPWNDRNLDSILVLRFAFLREYHARDIESADRYWRFMSREAECIAEAERDMFAELHDMLLEIENEYIESKYLDAELESFDATKIAKAIRAHAAAAEPELPDQAVRTRDRFGITRFMLPPDFLGHQTYQAQLLGLEKDNSDPLVVLPVRPKTQKYLRKWTDTASYLYSEIMTSTRILHHDLIREGEENNILTGPSAKSRRLLVNSSIPTADVETFLGWFGFVGFDWSYISPAGRQSLTQVIGHRPESLLTFLAPMLPMTREHQGGFGASIAQEDAHSNHSLSARNAAHLRNEHGGIIHGHYLVTTVAIGGGPPTVLVQSQLQGTARPAAIVAEHMSVLPASVRLEGPVITAGIDHDMRYGMYGVVANPWMANPGELPLPYEWPRYTDLPFDTAFRSLSRWHSTMFRIDSIPSANNWVEEFIRAAVEWQSATRADRMERYMHAVVDHWRESAPAIVTPKSGKGRFDFSSLGDSDA